MNDKILLIQSALKDIDISLKRPRK